jgi:hypothetical protein
MLTLLLLSTLALPALDQTLAAADQEALMKHVLTLANVKKVFAVDRELLQLAIEQPALAKKAAQVKPTGIEDAAKAIGEVPEVMAVLKKHGFTPREYLLNVFTMATTQVTHGFSAGKTADMPAGALKTNVEFWQANLAALKPSVDEWTKTRAELMKRIQQP